MFTNSNINTIQHIVVNNFPENINEIQYSTAQNGASGSIDFHKKRNHTEISTVQNDASGSNNFHKKRNNTEISTIQNGASGSRSIESIPNVTQISRNIQNVNKTSTSKSDTNNKDFKPFGSHPGEKLFILTGTVERVIQWNKLLSNKSCCFEVIAAVISLQEGKIRTQKVMLLRDRTGPILQVVYYPHITRLAIEDFDLGKMIRCVGHMIGSNILNAISIRNASNDEVESLQRLTLISEQAVSTHLKN
ncbi:unnamed protein product [Psylliodes chrysocephalus]|uniref:Uncharacterized protein n=1 Tax=Psylliodes chrysocephalus TaxID=3402493 RepID=A0A9P0G7L9_9CUCU|nr:unnamed protein product [Psylliodes chrysocephala]